MHIAGCAIFGWIRFWPLVVLNALGIVWNTVLLIIKCRENKMDKKHSEEFMRVKRAGDNSYEYAYTEYHKSSFDKIYDWERDEFEDLIWKKYNDGIIKFADLLPYLKNYDGISKLQSDLASPSTPDGWKSMISYALDQAAKENTPEHAEKMKIWRCIEVADKLKSRITDKEAVKNIVNAISLSLKWMHYDQDVSLELCDLLDNEEYGFTICQQSAEDDHMIDVWNCIIYAFAYICRKVFEKQGAEYFPEYLEAVDEETFTLMNDTFEKCMNEE